MYRRYCSKKPSISLFLHKKVPFRVSYNYYTFAFGILNENQLTSIIYFIYTVEYHEIQTTWIVFLHEPQMAPHVASVVCLQETNDELLACCHQGSELELRADEEYINDERQLQHDLNTTGILLHMAVKQLFRF